MIRISLSDVRIRCTWPLILRAYNYLNVLKRRHMKTKGVRGGTAKEIKCKDFGLASWFL